MQTLDTFLDHDIPLFLDTFEKNREKSEASEDEINRLLGHDYQRKVHHALHHGSFGAIPSTVYPMIKTTHIFTSIPKPLLQSTPTLLSDDSTSETFVSEEEIADIIPEDKKSDPTFDPKSLLRTLGSTRKEDLLIYVKALIALENKDKKEAVPFFYSLAVKYPRNLAFRIRLQDALLLPGEAISLPKLPKPVKESLEKQKVKLKQNVIVDRKSPNGFTVNKNDVVAKEYSTKHLDPYARAVEAIRNGDKDSAVNLLKELIRSRPNNLAFKLRLQEALEL
jgi:hypothetical protein